MQFKLDENLHPDTAELFRQNGHDALTVYDQGLRGHADNDFADVLGGHMQPAVQDRARLAAQDQV